MSRCCVNCIILVILGVLPTPGRVSTENLITGVAKVTLDEPMDISEKTTGTEKNESNETLPSSLVSSLAEREIF